MKRVKTRIIKGVGRMIRWLSKDILKTIILFLAVILIVIITVQLCFFPVSLEEISHLSLFFGRNTLIGIFSSIMAGTLLLYFIKYINPKVENVEIKELHPRCIIPYHLEARMKTKKWCYNGNRGEYTRNETLPSLAKICKEEGRSINVDIHILNPDNDLACKTYTEYKNNLSNIDKNVTIEQVKLDLLATIASAYRYKKESNLKIKVYLKNSFSPVRIEMSDSIVIATREDSRDPAIIYKYNSKFYNAYNFDLTQEANQNKKLNLKMELSEEDKSLSDVIKKLLSNNKIKTDYIDDDNWKTIEMLVDSKTTPYTTQSNKITAMV